MADQMLAIIAGLQEGEAAKRELILGTPEFLERAIEVEAIARLAFRWSQLQLQMAQVATARGPSPDGVPLSEVEPRPLDVILMQWREAQLRLEIAVPGSPEASKAADDVERLREEYQGGFRAIQ